MKTKLIYLCIILFLSALSACSAKRENAIKEQEIAVKTARVEFGEFPIPVVISGVVSSKREARLSFKTGGIINRLYVKTGDEIKKGQLLAALDMTEIDAQVTQAKNGRDKARRDFDRVNSLFNENAATMEQKQNVQTALDVAEQAYRIAKFNRQYSSIYATESGKVAQKFMNEGELASPGAPVYFICSSRKEDWVIKTAVSDKDWARLKKGDKADVMLDAYPGEKFTAAVTEISDAADPYSGTFQIELRLFPGDKKLAAGLVAKAVITPAKADKLYIIPIEALTESNKNRGNVFYPDGTAKSAEKTSVEIIKILNNKVAVKSGLENIDRVITDGLSYLIPGSKIKIMN
jgi:RND family efflux transporter MFP subunit